MDIYFRYYFKIELFFQSLKPFVTVSFLDSEERTSVAFGSNPSWNEQMELPWTQGISRLIGGSISKEEYIYINVFDEDLMIQGMFHYNIIFPQHLWLI